MPGDELYCYPGGDVLKNKLNITDAELLEYTERRLTAIRLDELLRRSVRGDFDFAHLKAIHFFYFSGLVYLGRATEKDQHCQRSFVLRGNVY